MISCDVGASKINNDRKMFEELVNLSNNFYSTGQNVASLVCAKIAAEYGSFRHPGIFVCPKLEEIILEIGRKTIRTSLHQGIQRATEGTPSHVLHVITYARSVGGDTRFIWRWIQKDRERSHSVLITGPQEDAVPKDLVDAVLQSGGTLHRIDPNVKSPLLRAQKLRDVSSCADLIALHLYPEDTLPLIAFANKHGLPPIVYVAQADERFWLGASIGDVFAHLRESGLNLSEERSGIPRGRISILPIPLVLKPRILTPSEAKRRLGLPEKSVLLLSIARAMKYVPISKTNFIKTIAPVLEKHDNAIMLVIGPENDGVWKAATQETGGRMRALGVISDTAIYYEAADIYVDSFPFSSNTSLLEAGSYGLPLVSYFSHSDKSDVLGPGAPGLDGFVIKVETMEDYFDSISRLITDFDFRKRLGEITRKNIAEFHDGWKWDQSLEDLYARAFSVPSTTSVHHLVQEPPCELDILVNRMYPHHSLGSIINSNLKNIPLFLRYKILVKLLRLDKSFSFELFMPDWFSAKYGGYFKGWRRLLGYPKTLKT